MIVERKGQFSRLFVFEADLIYIESSLNRVGVDPLPRFFIKPTAIKEVLNYSKSPSSVNAGYKKDKATGLYVKNIDKINKTELEIQFHMLKSEAPYGFTTESTYVDFVKYTFDPFYSKVLEERFASTFPKKTAERTEDGMVNVSHHYVKIEDLAVKTFNGSATKEFPQAKNLFINNLPTGTN